MVFIILLPKIYLFVLLYELLRLKEICSNYTVNVSTVSHLGNMKGLHPASDIEFDFWVVFVEPGVGLGNLCESLPTQDIL